MVGRDSFRGTGDLPAVNIGTTPANDMLLVEGDAHIDMPEGMEAVHADVRYSHYLRSFALSSEEVDKIDANFGDGVLILRIPRRPETRPRKK